MLSRVAAVKAPRTHNRRRVTGSSGRRREGGESEPQRPNMSRRVFTSTVLLLVVMMMCDTGRAAQAAEPTSDQGSSPSPSFVWRDKKDGETVDSLYAPSLVEVNGGVFAVAEAELKKKENEKTHFFTGIASELLALSEKNPKELAAANVKTKILENCSSQEEGKCPSPSTKQGGSQSEMKVYVSQPTTVVKESDIYMLAGTYIRENLAVCQGGPDAASWGLLLVKGNVSDTEGKEIVWEDTDGLPCSSIVGRHESLTELIGSGGSGVKMNDGTLVFPLEAMKKEKDDAEEDGKNKNVSLIIYSSDTKNWTLSKGMSDDGCSDPSVVEWEKDKLMMMTACDGGRRRVYESGDKGEEWTEALGTLSRVWGNNQKRHEKGVRSGFITATLEDRNVMLVTLPVYSENVEKGVLHLWLTDNTHIVDIGPVSGKDEDVAASSLLYRSGNNKELIALYEKKGGRATPSSGMFSVLLTEQLKRVKDVLTTWKEVDERVSSLCPTSIAEKDVSSDTACTTDKITEGLVGFLSGNFSGGTWKDEYLGVNATVTGAATKSESSGGITFKGRGAWAQWPVGKQGGNQLYHFANHNFTLVATVSVHVAPEGNTPIPLIGVKMDGDDNPVLLGLSYNKEKKWQALCCDGKTAEQSSTWEKDKTYQVAIVLQNGKQGSVYVDGQRVCESAQSNLENTESKKISHFYIGGDGGNAENTAGDEGVSVTVSNVLLYNRPLTFSGPDADLEKDVASPAGAVSRTKTRDEMKTEGNPATTQQVPTASSSHAVGEKTGDGDIVRGSGPLPSLLLLLGLWGFAAL
ncbi:trans-sialidase [Trypanosoma cruzi Dm28c]|uniref:Trans-sialidase n=2 Tax=Trypanosoma cruzi TaxID=5693 RepID=V5BBI1_TRYCR|nr:trans-sialidase [Trypanosoma cruzi Dm28c]PBJ77213.1 trans-sialidase [Trypanosoma cruzi cruzi]PWV03399.1 putative trans-sialidase, Group V [Trypanosoma cruzi]